MHTVSLTVAEIFAVRALSCFHPRAVPVLLITVFPHIDKVIFVDVSLSKIASYACARGN